MCDHYEDGSSIDGVGRMMSGATISGRMISGSSGNTDSRCAATAVEDLRDATLLIIVSKISTNSEKESSASERSLVAAKVKASASCSPFRFPLTLRCPEADIYALARSLE